MGFLASVVIPLAPRRIAMLSANPVPALLPQTSPSGNGCIRVSEGTGIYLSARTGRYLLQYSRHIISPQPEVHHLSRRMDQLPTYISALSFAERGELKG